MAPKPCRTGKRQFATKQAALARLREIQDNPEPGRLYHPTSVTDRCKGCGHYHLTSKPTKRWAKGKRSRQR